MNRHNNEAGRTVSRHDAVRGSGAMSHRGARRYTLRVIRGCSHAYGMLGLYREVGFTENNQINPIYTPSTQITQQFHSVCTP